MSRETNSVRLCVGAGCLVLSSYWLLSRLRKRRQSLTDSNNDDETKALQEQRRKLCKACHVGPRGQAALAPPIPYLGQFLVCLQNNCHHISNPEGHIPLCVAENKLVLDLLQDRILQMGTTSATFSHLDVYCYNSFLGLPVARQAAAYFIARRFLLPNDPEFTPEKAFAHVDPKYVALSTGASAVLSHLFYALGEQGNACLIPSPYYAAFENDMSVLAGIRPIAIDQENPVAGPTVDELEQSFRKAIKQKAKPRFILITNPNNPLGTIYSPEVLRRVIEWARAKKIHTIVDEIYALGAFNANRFKSVLEVLDNQLGVDVHFVWALSKDFGASGLRVGFVYSQNEILIEALATLNIFSCVSGPIQYLAAELMTDDLFVDEFLAESRRRVVESYQLCVSKLEEMVLPYVHAEAGMFVYVDFSSLLPQNTFEWETKLSNLMFEHARIVLTPGFSQRETKPGMFRICYAWVSLEVLVIAMERLSRLVAKIRRLDWDDLNEFSLSGIIT